MARARAKATTPEARFEASRILLARRQGYKNREIATAFGINERTVRKIVSGQTSGRRIYREKVAPARREGAQNLSIVRLDLVVGRDSAGQPIIRTVNAKTPLINGRTPTPFDVFMLPDLQAVATAETLRLKRQYAGAKIKEGIDSSDDRCERRKCGHKREDHDDEDGESGECLIEPAGHCDSFIEPDAIISSIRPIMHRDEHKRLVTITRTFA